MKFWLLFWVTFLSFFSALTYVILFLPEEAQQGAVQKIFFFHVPAAFMMYTYLVVGTVMSVLYLIQRRGIYDQVARSCIYTATLFACLVISSGPIWAKPIWGVYWTWDPRLTTSFIIFILLIAYVMVRKIFVEYEGVESRKGPIIGAVIAILALLDVPLIHFSVKLWRGIHPSVLEEPDGLPSSYQTGLEWMIASFILLGALTTWILYRYILCSEKQQLLLRKMNFDKEKI